LPYEWNRQVYNAAKASGGEANYDYLNGGYLTTMPDHVSDWADKHRVVRVGDFKAGLSNPPRSVKLSSNSAGNEYGAPEVWLDGKLAKSDSKLVMEFPEDTLRRRQLDNWARMGYLQGFSYLDNHASGNAFLFEKGTGPYPRCQYNNALERERGLCPPSSTGYSRYLIGKEGDLAGQR